ncbi:MAG: hypothetical protein ACYDB8_05015 [Acidiferrobacterales bacterium]
MKPPLPDLLQTLRGIADFGLLTAQGELSLPGKAGGGTMQQVPAGKPGKHAQEFLRSYLRHPDRPGWRLAVIHPSADPAARDHMILCFETEMIRQLYPAANRAAGTLTAFQQKSRRTDVVHGIALLLSQHPDVAPETFLYCPVLFDRHTTLAHYCDASGPTATAGLSDTPVIEVLNIAAPLALNQRANPEILALRTRLQRSLPIPDGLDTPDFHILDSLPQAQQADPSGDAEYFGVDKRTDRGLTLPERALQQLHLTHRQPLVERWLELPHRPVSAARLQEFMHFRDLGPADLEVLAARAFVYTAEPGSTLLDLGMTDPWNMYLLEGTVLLTAADGAGYPVTGGSNTASSPVAFLKPRKYAVAALTKVSFLWIHDEVLRVLHAGARPESGRRPETSGPADNPDRR